MSILICQKLQRSMKKANKESEHGKGKVYSCYYLMDNNMSLYNKEMDIFKLEALVFRIAVIKREDLNMCMREFLDFNLVLISLLLRMSL